VIEIEILHSNKGIFGYQVSGHAMGSNRSEKYDLVCCAVSVLVLTITNGLTDVLKVTPDTLEVGDTGGLIRCILPQGLEPVLSCQVSALLETLVMGLEEIARDYPEYVRLKEIY
ncbi:MAG: ribosomal-processing cysteine protease Prp, partial [Thermincolia bacterium]